MTDEARKGGSGNGNCGGHTDPALKARLLELMHGRGWGQRRVADLLGISQSALSQWLQDKYASAETMNRRVEELLEERKAAGEGIVPSEGYQIIQEVCAQCQEERKFGVILGNPGVGKSKALSLYAQEHDDVLYIKADVTTNAKVMLETICGLRGGGLTVAQLMVEAKATAEGKLIIVDEADLLPVRVLEALRAIFDEGRTGLVLAGEPRLERLMRRGPHATENLAQLYSRVDFNILVTNPSEADMKAFLDTTGVEDREARRLLTHAGSKGSFRAASKLLNQSIRLAKVNNAPVTGPVMKAASRLIMHPQIQA
jgi:DNA transposition AAA+ family ATPase